MLVSLCSPMTRGSYCKRVVEKLNNNIGNFNFIYSFNELNSTGVISRNLAISLTFISPKVPNYNPKVKMEAAFVSSNKLSHFFIGTSVPHCWCSHPM